MLKNLTKIKLYDFEAKVYEDKYLTYCAILDKHPSSFWKK